MIFARKFAEPINRNQGLYCHGRNCFVNGRQRTIPQLITTINYSHYGNLENSPTTINLSMFSYQKFIENMIKDFYVNNFICNNNNNNATLYNNDNCSREC